MANIGKPQRVHEIEPAVEPWELPAEEPQETPVEQPQPEWKEVPR